MEEVWKKIIGYEDRYLISNFGRIKIISKRGFPCDKPKKTTIRDKKYTYVVLYKDGIHKCFTVHRLVAKTFIPNPNNKEFVNHKDGNKNNNHVTNLEWVTAQENCRHSWDNGFSYTSDKNKEHTRKLGLSNKGSNHPMVKTTETKIKKAFTLRKKGYKIKDIAKAIGLSRQQTGLILRGGSWKHLKLVINK